MEKAFQSHSIYYLIEAEETYHGLLPNKDWFCSLPDSPQVASGNLTLAEYILFEYDTFKSGECSSTKLAGRKCSYTAIRAAHPFSLLLWFSLLNKRTEKPGICRLYSL